MVFKSKNCFGVTIAAFAFWSNAHSEPIVPISKAVIVQGMQNQALQLEAPTFAGYGTIYELSGDEVLIQENDINFGDIFFRAKFKYLQPLSVTADIIHQATIPRVREILIHSGSQGYVSGPFRTNVTVGRIRLANRDGMPNVIELSCFFDTATNDSSHLCFVQDSAGLHPITQYSNPYFSSQFSFVPLQIDILPFSVERLPKEAAFEHKFEYRLKNKALMTWRVEMLVDNRVVETIEIVRRKDETIKFETPFGVFDIGSGNTTRSLKITTPIAPN
mgnify:FL=1